MEFYLGCDALYPVVSLCIVGIIVLNFAELVDSTSQKKCTQRVKEEREKYVIQKISVRRKIRARCSESEEYWSSFSGKNCKDRYKIMYMTERRRMKFTTYRMEQICCPNEVGDWCKKGESPPLDRSTAHSPNTITVVTIVVPIVAVILLILGAILLIVLWRKNRKRNLAKQQAYHNVKGSNRAINVDARSDGDEVNSKLIPFSVQVVDNTPPSAPHLVSYPVSQPVYHPVPHSVPHPHTEQSSTPGGCHPFTDRHDVVQDVHGQQSENYSVASCKLNPESREDTDEDDDKTASCDELKQDALRELILKNQGIATETEASAPSLNVLET